MNEMPADLPATLMAELKKDEISDAEGDTVLCLLQSPQESEVSGTEINIID